MIVSGDKNFLKYRFFLGDLGETRVMIFSQYRDSVNEITEILNRHRPLVKVMSFVGHSTGKTTKGFSQKDQLRVNSFITLCSQPDQTLHNVITFGFIVTTSNAIDISLYNLMYKVEFVSWI